MQIGDSENGFLPSNKCRKFGCYWFDSCWLWAGHFGISGVVIAVCDFRVVDESADWIVVDKPAPLIVHPANGKAEPSLLGGLEQLLACELANGGRLSVMTRLDRETSGLVFVAKSREAAREFGACSERHEIEKGYLAVVHGWPEWDEMTCAEPILRAGEVGESAIWLRRRVHPAGKPCATRFRVRETFERDGRFVLVECVPVTGRTHQIRVHLESLRHPLVGDKIYGTDGRAYLEQLAGEVSESSWRALRLARHALHASRMAVVLGGEELEWKSPLPDDLIRFIHGSPIQPHTHDSIA